MKHTIPLTLDHGTYLIKSGYFGICRAGLQRMFTFPMNTPRIWLSLSDTPTKQSQPLDVSLADDGWYDISCNEKELSTCLEPGSDPYLAVERVLKAKGRQLRPGGRHATLHLTLQYEVT